MSTVDTYFNQSKTRLFVLIVLCNVSIAWISKAILINDIVFYNTFSEQLTYERSMELFNEMKRIAWIGYAMIPIILFLKFTLISIVLYTGIFLYDLSTRVSFSSVFRIVVACEIIIVAASLIKFLWFVFFGGNYDLNDLSFFYPLALINIFNISEVSKMWVYPLQIVNLFQIFYIAAISFGLTRYAGMSGKSSDKVVLTSYIPSAIIWVVLIMFISIDKTI